MSALSTYNLITTTYLFEELLQGFDVFIGHICYGVGVGAVEVDEPLFCAGEVCVYSHTLLLRTVQMV